MKSIINLIGIIGILVCFTGVIQQYLARKHLKDNSTLSRLEILKSLKRAPIDDYSEVGKQYLSRSDNCAAIGVSLVLAFAIFSGMID